MVKTKKGAILELYAEGVTDPVRLALLTHSRPSYVASVLQQAGVLKGYFDLYTGSEAPMNIYAPLFTGKIGFRDVATAHRGIKILEKFYRQFDSIGDRAGQHHTLLVALTMCNRARWSEKKEPARVYRRWLEDKLGEELSPLSHPLDEAG